MSTDNEDTTGLPRSVLLSLVLKSGSAMTGTVAYGPAASPLPFCGWLELIALIQAAHDGLGEAADVDVADDHARS